MILTPKDLLTKDDTWISHSDLVARFDEILPSIENEQLRAEINNYFHSATAEDAKPSDEDRCRTVESTVLRYPEIIDYYISLKEHLGEEAVATSEQKVSESDALYVRQFGGLAMLPHSGNPFYRVPGTTKEEVREKITFFKDGRYVDNDCHKVDWDK